MQTIRLLTTADLSTPKLYLWDLDGAAVGEVGGYTLTELAPGLYSASVADGVVLTDRVGEVRSDSTSVGTDYVRQHQGNWWVGETPGLNEFFSSGNMDGYTLEETLRLCLAMLAGKVAGAGTTTVTIRAADDSKDRITATVDNRGNRTSITLDGT